MIQTPVISEDGSFQGHRQSGIFAGMSNTDMLLTGPLDSLEGCNASLAHQLIWGIRFYSWLWDVGLAFLSRGTQQSWFSHWFPEKTLTTRLGFPLGFFKHTKHPGRHPPKARAEPPKPSNPREFVSEARTATGECQPRSHQQKGRRWQKGLRYPPIQRCILLGC